MINGLFPSEPLLLVDDNEIELKNSRLLLKQEGITNIVLCQDSREVMSVLSRQGVEVILLDLRMPFISGEELLRQISSNYPGIPIIIITGVEDTPTVVKCMKMGAFDFIVKPLDQNRLITSVRHALRFRQLQRENINLKSHFLAATLNNPEAFREFNTHNEIMKSIFRYMEVIALSAEPVLITGETGSGKELIARALKNLSNRKGAMVTVNVAGLDDQLFPDTLFGHIKGAFTDAHQPRKGLVEQASGGILFLDEIGDLSLSSQVKLLRLIQEHEYYPIGSDTPRHTDTRIFVATNKNLEQLQEKGKFRKDLYYRLCVHHIHVPPLRERTEDIPLLVDFFLAEAAEKLGKPKPTVPVELYTLLSTYYFPGNIRELRAIVYDAVSRHTSRKMSLDLFKVSIQSNKRFEDLSTPLVPIPDDSLFSHKTRLPTLKEIQDMLVKEALKRSRNNQSIAAQMLGVTRQALNKRLKDIKTRK